MRILRIGIVWLVVIGLSTSALAGDLQTSAAQAAQQQTQTQDRSIPKGYLWAGTALFVGGMTAGIYGFLNNRNGSLPGADEANATNKHLGAAGLITAFVGGSILALGQHRASHAPAVTFGPGRLTVSKQVSW
ncbi:MAG: hypothetical protein AUF76_09815 [Acidobacteria bacterium 13_1_20CM_2_65_9]|nr:MAG: hypothetical protein AUF76_09815 [Acidobacteria bacterium 13_1_20CM_2_65_9]